MVQPKLSSLFGDDLFVSHVGNKYLKQEKKTLFPMKKVQIVYVLDLLNVDTFEQITFNFPTGRIRLKNTAVLCLVLRILTDFPYISVGKQCLAVNPDPKNCV